MDSKKSMDLGSQCFPSIWIFTHLKQCEADLEMSDTCWPIQTEVKQDVHGSTRATENKHQRKWEMKVNVTDFGILRTFEFDVLILIGLLDYRW